jgi:3-demethoxyubiquinol 3-hydroxylase
MQQLTRIDQHLAELDHALRVLVAPARAARPTPAASATETELPDADRRAAAELMRVNHVGEVCAQALYRSQARWARDPALKAELLAAAQEETDHLAWCAERLAELNARPSALNPLWYVGAYAFGWIAGRIGDDANLSFVIETERQVEAHLTDHLSRLPATDQRSRAIVETMRADEARHADEAERRGGQKPSALIGGLMALAAGVMKRVAAKI